MNKFIFTPLVFICLFSGTILAQNNTDTLRLISKKGERFLPEKGDCSIMLDASPFLDYMGKLLSGTGSSSPVVNSVANFPMTIGGKYFTSNNSAYRIKIRLGINSQTITNSVIDNNNTSLDTVYLKDTKKTNGSDINICIGKEFRRGKSRLQGYYGLEGIIGISSYKNVYRYANSYSNTLASPTSTDFNTIATTGFASGPSASRLITDKNGTTVKVGARGFGGVEYFIIPKISLGLEFGWGLSYSNTNDGQVTTETWDPVNSGVKTKTIAKSGSRGFGVDTDNSGGALMVHFYF